MANTLGITLPLRRGTGGYFEGTQDLRVQVRSNLTNLLLTQKGERAMQPEFGSDLHSLLFDTASDDLFSEVDAAIQSSVSRWLPYVSIEEIEQTRSTDGHSIFVKISFSLRNIDSSLDNITLVF